MMSHLNILSLIACLLINTVGHAENAGRQPTSPIRIAEIDLKAVREPRGGVKIDFTATVAGQGVADTTLRVRLVDPAGGSVPGFPLAVPVDAIGSAGFSATLNDPAPLRTEDPSQAPRVRLELFDAEGRVLDTLEQPFRIKDTSAQLRQALRNPDRVNWKVIFTDSAEPGEGDHAHVIDGDPRSFWHTRWSGGQPPPFPHEIRLDLGRVVPVQTVIQLPRQDVANGRVRRFTLYLSRENGNWGAAAAEGEFKNNANPQEIRLPKPVQARYLRLVAHNEWRGAPYATIAELSILPAE